MLINEAMYGIIICLISSGTRIDFLLVHFRPGKKLNIKPVKIELIY